MTIGTRRVFGLDVKNGSRISLVSAGLRPITQFSKTLSHKCGSDASFSPPEFKPSRILGRNYRNMGMLNETIEFLDGIRSPADMLAYVDSVGRRLPLATCGHVKSECWRAGVIPTKACSGCKCIRYCGPKHQKSVRAAPWFIWYSSQKVRYTVADQCVMYRTGSATK